MPSISLGEVRSIIVCGTDDACACISVRVSAYMLRRCYMQVADNAVNNC